MFDKNQLVKILEKGEFSFKDLAKKLSIPRYKNKEFSKELFDLVNKNEIFMTPERNFYIPEFLDEIEGEIRLNSKGFGFVDKDDTSYFIAPGSTLSAMDGDIVKIKIFKDLKKEGQYQGLVVDVIERKNLQFVGRIVTFGSALGIKPFNQKIFGKFRFVDEKDLKPGLEVKVKIVKFGPINQIEIVKILGNYDDVSMDILVAIEDANVPIEFSEETNKEILTIPDEVSEKDLEGREDYRDRLIVTIDGDDTKDFDDAVEVYQKENGNYVLGVHIADVTYYVKEDAPLDSDARGRGTSVYLADRVIPMLPKKLSNGICSLNPNVDRLVISAIMEIDKDGNTVDYKITEGVINSKYRLTYQQVNKYVAGLMTWEDKNLCQMIDKALELSHIIRKYKDKEGYIDFEIEESKIIVDENGKTTAIVPRERLDSEMLIEDFMVRANETVAHHFSKNKLSSIYRVHDKPDMDRIINLNNVIKVLGIDVTVPHNAIPSEFAKAIEQIKATRFDDFMKLMMLRTMAKAVYSPDNIGHFGLASKFYTHFTSPIRRYPDLIIHRMLREYFFKGNKNLSVHFATIMPSIAEHSSMTEQRAMDLERKVADIKKAEFYEQFIGQSFEGSIVSMMKFGFFVEFPNKVDGLVHTSTLIDGEYKLTDSGYTLKSPKRKFTVGDKVKVTVVGAEKEVGKIDLVLTDLYEEWKQKEQQKNVIKK